jgi:hypothetical protein
MVSTSDKPIIKLDNFNCIDFSVQGGTQINGRFYYKVERYNNLEEAKNHCNPDQIIGEAKTAAFVLSLTQNSINVKPVNAY